MHRFHRVIAAVIAAAATFAPLGAQQATLIVNASVIDGTGSPARRADVRVVGDRITAIGTGQRDPNDRVVDANGLTLAPGFIDTHSHHDRGLFTSRGALGAVSQGITTIVVGQDGGSRFPLRDLFARLDTQPAAVNVASYVGHGTLRRRVLGDDYKRAATAVEVARMEALLREEMTAGALGLSTGLEYDPGIFSAPSEVLALAKVAGEFGGRYISHIRSEDREFWQALDELIRIGREARVPVQVSHMKLAMRGLWGRGDSLVRVLDRARASGVDVTADVYPWTMWQSGLTVLYPKRNFTDRAETDFILKEVASPDDLLIGRFEPNPAYAGKTVRQIAALRKSDPASTLMWLIAETEPSGRYATVVATGMDERDIAKLLKWPYTNVCSDGELDGPHPRGFGSFTRVLGKYVRDERVLTLEDAVRKMTSLAAANVGIHDRGVIRPGMAADLVLFDPKTVADRATIAAPHAVSTGIQTVWVNGRMVYDAGRGTAAYAGKSLRRHAPRGTPGATPSPDSVDAFVRAEMQRQRIPGVAVAIVKNGTVWSSRGYGYANVEHMVPVTDQTIFQSGSLGKMFTAAGVMLLVEDGKLALTDTITKFFPDAPESWRSITVRNLLTHTSGIPDSYGDDYDFRKDYTEQELWRMAFKTPLEFPPGSRWNYSNTGYQLLGFIIRKASGQFYGDFLAERVFKPAGMTTTRVITETDVVPNRSAGYRLVRGELKNQEWVAPALNTTADGALYWSLRDLVAWDDVVRNRRILKSESWNQILSPVRLASGKPYPYGFGWSLDDRNGLPMQGHGGAWQGFKTQLSRFLSDSLDVIVLANLSQANPSRFADGIAAMWNTRLAVLVPKPIPDTEPRVVGKLTQVFDLLRDGKLTPADFAYVRAGFFPAAANAYGATLRRLGAPTTFTLLERREIGDDRVYLYDVAFGDRVAQVRLALAPDDKVSQFGMTERRP